MEVLSDVLVEVLTVVIDVEVLINMNENVSAVVVNALELFVSIL